MLGIEWLETLGDIQANFKTLTLKFEIEGQTQVVRGDPSLCKSVASLKNLFKALQKDAEGYYVDLNELTVREEQENLDLQQLLEEFGTLFEEPKGLPPSRSHDHAIQLKTGTNPPNIRPYHYPHYQKNEIERIVREMLVAGIIQPSTSPFSSPVLLVRKKDGSWRFCVDYRALNKITIPDKFPIPAIDELLDELGGATIFSKLDLRSGYHQIRVCKEDVRRQLFVHMKATMSFWSCLLD